MADLEQEVTLELLTDLATAIRGVLRTVVPDMPVEVVVTPGPEPSITVRVRKRTTIYPTFIRARVALRPTTTGRRLLGLPEREE